MFWMHGEPCLTLDLCGSPLRRARMDTVELLGGIGLFQASFILGHTPVDLLDCMFAGITILFLKQTNQDIKFSGGSFQIVVGEFAPPRLGLALDLFPFAFKYIFVHGSSFGSFEKLSHGCGADTAYLLLDWYSSASAFSFCSRLK